MISARLIEQKTGICCKVGEICEISRGRVISQNYIKENSGRYPVYSSQTVNDGELGRLDTYDYDGEYLTWTTDGVYAGTLFYRCGKFNVTNVCGVLKLKNPEILLKYLYYALNFKIKNYVNRDIANHKLMCNMIAKIELWIPKLEVQKKIIQILELFDELTDTLKTEQLSRQKQYEYYRAKLIGEIKSSTPRAATIEEVCEISRGRVISQNYIKENSGRYPVYSSQTVNDGELGRLDTYDYDGEYLTWTTDGVYAGTLFYRCGKFNVTNVCGVLKLKNPEILTKYLYYALNQEMKRSVNRDAAIYKLLNSRIAKVKISIPEIEIQKKIVSILYPMEQLYRDPKIGIPAEIGLRKLQYNNYLKQFFKFNSP